MPELREELENALCKMKTKSNARCVGFKLTSNPEKVRMIFQSILDSSKYERILPPEQLAELIMSQAEQEASGGVCKGFEEEDGQVGKVIADAMERVVVLLLEKIRSVQMKASLLMNGNPKRKTNRFTKLLEFLNDPNFGEKVDEAISEMVKEKESWQHGSQGKEDIIMQISRELNEIEEGFKKEIAESKRKLEEEIKRKKGNYVLIKEEVCEKASSQNALQMIPGLTVQHLNLREMTMNMGEVSMIQRPNNSGTKIKGFAKNALTPMKDAQSSLRSKSDNPALWILKQPNSDNQYAVYFQSGLLVLLDLEREITSKSIRIDTSGENKYMMESASIDFNKSGEFILVNIPTHRLMALRCSDFMRVGDWKAKMTYFTVAKWIDNQRVLATYPDQRELRIYQVGTLAMVSKFKLKLPGELFPVKLEYFALSKTFNCIIGVSNTLVNDTKREKTLVFKANLNSDVIWNQKKKGGESIWEIQVSDCGKLLICGDESGTIALIKEEKGEALGIFEKMNGDITKICWSPDSNYVIVLSYFELGLFQINFQENEKDNGLEALQKLETISANDLKMEKLMTGCLKWWSNEENSRPTIVFADLKQIMKLPLC